MDWKVIALGISGALAFAGFVIFLIVAGKKLAKLEEEEAKRKRAEQEAKRISEAAAAQRERESHHVERVKDIIRHADDLGPDEFELRLNSYPSENRATQAAGARRDAH
ncbi:MAG TPA: hypothetical protein DF383_04975 [Deltaproteobacteria bacterium]|nr:hypothetical protein [Deltaproteobacteria bacterium]